MEKKYNIFIRVNQKREKIIFIFLFRHFIWQFFLCNFFSMLKFIISNRNLQKKEEISENSWFSNNLFLFPHFFLSAWHMNIVKFKMSSSIRFIVPSWVSTTSSSSNNTKYVVFEQSNQQSNIEYDSNQRSINYKQQNSNKNYLDKHGLSPFTGQHYNANYEYDNAQYTVERILANDGTVFEFVRPPNINDWYSIWCKSNHLW